ncbi:hypothetical protein [Apilactobacillus apinorum]|uniref:hypothetical protein n=1 Tax=Apilactobacillus apinorum TaxID=1218495 RepID=UPI0006B5A8C1|nr:hypothetical protein [Apilactobacillus apinorum]KOY69009.1 Uncharacterized protein RZ74_08090 [Apilactobacillus apinorum]CAI2679729.1 Uncharacterized protein AAPFHON13_08590 [Apilactobacillus apinorum]
MSVDITNLTVENTILANTANKVGLNVIITDSNVDCANGKKIVPAGTPVGGPNKLADDENANLNVANDSTAQGILLHDVDVTDGNGNGTVLVEGYINENKIPPISDDAKKALSNITFLKK